MHPCIPRTWPSPLQPRRQPLFHPSLTSTDHANINEAETLSLSPPSLSISYLSTSTLIDNGAPPLLSPITISACRCRQGPAVDSLCSNRDCCPHPNRGRDDTPTSTIATAGHHHRHFDVAARHQWRLYADQPAGPKLRRRWIPSADHSVMGSWRR